jgi:rhodanese-related sulfurtransferase
VTPKGLNEAIADGAAPAILDVRSRDEYAAGHVRGAVNIPFNEVGRRVHELNAWRDRPLVVYCGHGPRAWIASLMLRRHRFGKVVFLDGHMAAWRRAGLPEETGQAQALA